MKGGIIPVLCLGNERTPLLWMVMHKAPEILLDAPIHNLCLIVGLWMVSRRHTQLCYCHFLKLLLKQAHKYRVSVTYN